MAKITQKQARANEEAVWKVYPKATYFGVDAKKNFSHPEFCVCEVYQSDDWDAPVIGTGDTYEEAWADAATRLNTRYYDKFGEGNIPKRSIKRGKNERR